MDVDKNNMNKSMQMNHSSSNKFINYDYDNPRRFGMSSLQSCSTLQKSIPVLSFSRSPRFDKISKDLTNSNSTYSFSSSIRNDKGTSFGYGKKLDLSKVNFKVPGPGNYNLSKNDYSKNGFSIHKKYPKPPMFNTPSCQQYVIKHFLEEKDKILPTIIPRRTWYYEEEIKKTNQVGPGAYKVNFIDSERYTTIRFGIGQKLNKYSSKLIIYLDEIPGVGTYNLPKMIASKIRPPIN